MNIFKYLKFDASKNQIIWRELKEINSNIYNIFSINY